MSDDAASLIRQLDDLNRIGAALSAERDTSALLNLILSGARALTSSDAGSLYLVVPADGADPDDEQAPRELRFAVAQNDSVDLPFTATALEITERSIAGYVAQTGQAVRLDDAYALPAGVPYAFDRDFDSAAGYRTHSVLAVPMRTPKGRIVGVVQLINTRPAGAVSSYSARQEALALSLASQAAVAVENSELYAAIQRLFEGFVRASVVAIEARDPATSGHSFRVANLTVAFAELVDRAGEGPFAAVRFSREELRTIRYASLLHDFGKVGVREDVLVKAKKLYPGQHALIHERVKLARRTRELESTERRLAYLLAHGRDAYLARAADFEAALAADLAGLEAAWQVIETANEPTVLPGGTFERLRELAGITFPDADGSVRPLLDEDEVRLLSLRKGSLSEAERLQIEAHVGHSYRFLRQIPWTSEIRRIPEIVVGHHEKLNGTGYPNRLTAPDIPIQTRMMTIADIFDALSAADRPYKNAVPVDRALDILQLAAQDGEIDAALFQLFREGRVYEKWMVEAYPY